MKKILSIIFILVIFIFSLHTFFIKNDLPTEYKLYEVDYVVDGDTIRLKKFDKSIRLIGINAPESKHKNKSLNTIEGEEVSNLLKDLLRNKKVYLEYDLDCYDKYNRILAYVFLEDGKMLNKILLRNKYVEIMTVEPNTKYLDDFLKIKD